MNFLLQFKPSLSKKNALYVLGMVLGILVLLRYETFWRWPAIVELGMKAMSFLLLTAHLFFTIPKYGSQSIIVLIVIFLLMLVGINMDRSFMMFLTCALVFGAKGLDFRNIVKWYFVIGFLFVLVTYIGSEYGLLRSRDMFISKTTSRMTLSTFGKRLSFGYVWSTDFATHCFFVLLAYWYLRKAALTKLEVLLFVVIAGFIVYYTDAKLGAGCIVLLPLLTFYNLLIKRLALFRKSLMLLIGSVPFFCFLSVFCTLMFDRSDLTWFFIDTVILAGRLRLGSEAIDDYGVTLFGQEVKMYGADSNASYYNFIDSSYIQSLVLFGIFYTTLLLFSYMMINRRAYRYKDNALILAVFVSGLSGVIAQHFLQICMNPFLIALFAKHIYQQNKNI